jgi:hypothetical protein
VTSEEEDDDEKGDEVDIGDEQTEPKASVAKWALAYNKGQMLYLVFGSIAALAEGS